MTIGSELHHLIKLLSKSEKKLFKLYANRQGEGKAYIELFDKLESMENYNEEKLNSFFKGQYSANTLSKHKRYLLDVIIKSLSAQISYETSQYDLNDLYIQLDFLESKGMYALGLNVLNKAKEMAYQMELYLDIIKLIQKEYSFIWKAKEDISTRTETLNEEYAKVISLYKNFLDYDLLFRQHVPLHILSGSDIEEKRKLFYSNPLLVNLKNALSSKAKERAYHILSIKAGFESDYDAQLKYQHEILLQFKKDKNLTLRPMEYASRIFNFLLASKNANQFEYYPQYLSELNELSHKKIKYEDKKRMLAYYVILNLIYLLKTNKLSEGKIFLEEINSSKLMKEIEEMEFLSINLFFSKFQIYYWLKEYQKAFSILQTLYDKKSIKMFIPLIKLLEIIVHYDSNKIDLTVYQIENLYKFLRSTTDEKDKHQLELLILNKLKKIISLTDQKLIKREFLTLNNELDNIFLKPNEKIKSEYFDFILWSKSHA